MTNSTTNNSNTILVGILGATGTVGQRFIQLLSAHPYFTILAFGASPRSAGKLYKNAVQWKLATDIPSHIGEMVVQNCTPEMFGGCRVIFSGKVEWIIRLFINILLIAHLKLNKLSGLDADIAGDIELAFAKAGFAVFSNAKNHRMDPLVPLVVPLVNPSHLDLVRHQQKIKQFGSGFIVTNANCSTTGLVVPLKPLVDAFGPISKMIVNTLQAISGAGYPGVPSLDIFDNVVPYIGGEEPKLEEEPLKILGKYDGGESVELVQGMRISATCHRVPVLDGHTESVSIEFANKPSPSVEDIKRVLSSYQPDYVGSPSPGLAMIKGKKIISAPSHAIYVTEEPNRPQPRLDRERDHGMAVTVGRVRPCNVLDIKFTLLSHNTLLGAAGSSVLNAECAVARGLI